MELAELETLQRALKLHRAGRLGVLYCEDAELYVCGHPFDPLGYIDPLRNAVPYSYAELTALVAELEADPSLLWIYAPHGPHGRKQPATARAVSLNIGRAS